MAVCPPCVDHSVADAVASVSAPPKSPTVTRRSSTPPGIGSVSVHTTSAFGGDSKVQAGRACWKESESLDLWDPAIEHYQTRYLWGFRQHL
jgi:hypothetical protein